MNRQGHAMVQHESNEIDPRERWPYWGCRCGKVYTMPSFPFGTASRSVARVLHRSHLIEHGATP